MAGLAIAVAGTVGGVVCLLVEPTVIAGLPAADLVIGASAADPRTAIATIAPPPIAAETARTLVLRRVL